MHGAGRLNRTLGEITKTNTRQNVNLADNGSFNKVAIDIETEL